MVPSGPPNPVGGAQTVNTSALLRNNSGILVGQGGGSMQPGFPSLVSPRSQYGNMLGNLSSVSSLIGSGNTVGSICANQSFSGANGPQNTNNTLPGPSTLHRGGGMPADCDPLSGVANGLGCNGSPMSFISAGNPGATSSGLNGSVMASGGNPFQNQESQQLDVQNFQLDQQGHDAANNLQVQSQHMLGARGLQHIVNQNTGGLGPSQQHQLQSLRTLNTEQNGPQTIQSLRSLVPVKLEPQVTNDQSNQQQQLQALRSMGSIKLEPQQQQQQMASLRSIGAIKNEPQHTDQSLYLQQQQQQHQQQVLQMTRQSSQQMQIQAAQINMIQQQRLLQQQQQQQQILKTLPIQRSQIQQQSMQPFQQHNLPIRSAVKQIIYEPGMCARRLTQYMCHQQHRPADNNIEFWRQFVAEYFAPHAKKRWCVSLYGNGRHTTGVFPQDVWHCEICKIKPGRGFETTVEVLPRLCKIKYDSGTLEELLYVDMPREYTSPSGHIVLDYGKAIQESVFEQLRVVRDGQLRVVFSMDLKICSWEFCARRHEELIPRRLIISQVGQLGTVAQKYQAATQNASSNLSAQELQNNCNMFVTAARNLAKAMEVPLVNDLGYTKRYVRCLQISEVVNSMKDLIDYSRETGTGPKESLVNFPRRTAGSSGVTSQSQGQQPQQQQQQQQQQQDEHSRGAQSGPGSVQTATVQQLTPNNGACHNTSPTSTGTSSTIAGLLHQNSLNQRQGLDNPLNNGNSPFGNSLQISSAGSSSSLQQNLNPSSPFQKAANAAGNPAAQASLSSSVNSPANIPLPQQTSLSGEVDPDDSQSSVQQIIQEMMMSNQLTSGGNMIGVASVGNEMKTMNTNMMSAHALKGVPNGMVANGVSSSMGINGVGYGGGSLGGINPMSTVTMNGIRIAMNNNSLSALNGRISMPSMSQDPNMNQQQELGNRMLAGFGNVNSFNNLQFDWKPSP